MKPDEARAMAMALPEVTEEPHVEAASFRMRGKVFATVPPGENVMRVFVGEDETRAAVEANPTTYFEVWWGKPLAGLGVRLGKGRKGELAELLEEAWRRKAPKKLLRDLDAGRGGG